MIHRQACITLDLEPDHAGRSKEERYDAWARSNIQELMTVLQQHHVPLSAFVVGKSIKKNSDIITYLVHRKTEFYLHSYSHDLNKPDSVTEISRGVKVFRAFFRTPPLGYRAPEGRISKEGYAILKKHGFIFDSSVFPSFWPRPKYFFSKKTIHKNEFDMIEIPITVVSPLQLIFSLSWIHLIGWNIYKLLLTVFPLPNTVVFDFHLHDLYTVPTTKSLPMFWRYIYRKNAKNELQLLHEVIEYLHKKGYTFVPISALATYTHI